MKIYETIMIDIKNIQGETILSVPITEECVHVEELMKSDYVELSWNSDQNEEIPVGAYIILDGEKYSLWIHIIQNKRTRSNFNTNHNFIRNLYHGVKCLFSCILTMRITR